MRHAQALLFLLAAPAFSQADIVFQTEYDVVLTVGENQYRSQDQARVKNNHVLSVEFQEYKVELRISLQDADIYMVEIAIFESANSDWVRMDNDESGGFGGGIGESSSFHFNGDGLRLDMAIEVSIAD